MDRLPGKPISYWIDTVAPNPYPALAGDLSYDAAVIGAGIVGLTTALLLKQSGKSVAVLEGRRVGEQVSGHTTAKITAQHGLIYNRLVEDFGKDGARAYAQSQQAAVERVAALAAGFAADCLFERKAAYIYTADPDRVDMLRHEAETARHLGLPAIFLEDIPAPLAVNGAVRLANQAQFHPLQYLRGLARAIPGEGSQIFEMTRVVGLDDSVSPIRLTTDRGTVRAAEVVLATHLPFLNRGAYFAKCFPQHHMLVAARLSPSEAPNGMFLSVDAPSHSFRMTPDPAGAVLVAVGPAFKPGHSDGWRETADLVAFVTENFPSSEILCRWGNQDYVSADRLPYIGHLTSSSDHLWTATGFGAWGMSSGTLAAMIISDLIQGRANPWAELYDSTRVKPAVTAGKLVSENLSVAADWIEDKLARPDASPADLKPGEGGVVAGKDGKLAAWRDDQGTLHAFSATCPHMGCVVQWNKAEMTWDCPCHGSRFTPSGEVIHGPAVAGLRRASAE